MKNELKATLDWILNVLKRTPFPYSPQEALLRGHDSKKPFFFDGKYGKPLNWGDYQDLGKIQKNPKLFDKLMKKWHDNELVTAIGATAGFNGEFIVAYIDFDLGNYLSKEAMMSDINNWIENYPALKMAPKLSSQSGGIHIVVGFERVDTNNKIDFTLTKGTKKAGELFVGSGSTCILVGEGIEGNYLWLENAYGKVPVFPDPESIGVFEAKKFEAKKEEIKVNNNYKISSIYDNPDTVEQAREALAFIPVSNYDNDYTGWVELGMACKAAGLPIDDWDNWCKGSTKYKNYNEIETKWKSFKDGGGITAATLFKAAKDNGWKPAKTHQQPQSKPSHQISGTAALKPEQQSNIVPMRVKKLENLPPIKDEILKLFNENLSKSELEDRIQELAGTYNRQPNNVWKLYYKYSEEKEKEIGKDEQKANLDKLLKLSQKSLDLSDYLHPNLSTPLKNIANWMGTSQEAILTTFLPVAASLIHLDTQLELTKTDLFATPIIWSGVVAESGSLKSPTQKILINPLYKLQEKTDSVYDNEFQYYQEDLEIYNKNKRDKNAPPMTPPEAPKRREYFVSDITLEAMTLVQSEQPDRGFLVHMDELKALISSQDAYRGGKGADKEKILSARDGSGIKVNRAGGKRLFCPRSGWNITGGIQPDVLKKLMGDFDDSDGFWARFIWCVLPCSASPYPENAVRFNINNLLIDVYQKLESEAPQTHQLSKDAIEIYKNWYNHLDGLKLSEIRQSMRAVYSKFKRTTGEIALILHRINYAAEGKTSSEFVSKATMRAAINLAKFYISQVKLIHADGAAEHGQLEGKLMKIQKFAESQKSQKEWISSSDVKSGVRPWKQSNPDDIRQAFLDLAEFGYGTTQGAGKSLKYRANPQNLTKLDTTSNSTKTVKSIDSIGLEDDNQNSKLDKLDKNLTHSQESKSIDFIGLQPLNNSKVDNLTHNQDSNIIQPLDVPQNLGNQTDILESRQVCQEMPSTPEAIRVDTLSTSVKFASSLSSFSERSPEPTPPSEPLPDDYRPTLTELTSAEPLPPLTHIACVVYVEPTPELEPDTDDEILTAIGIIIDELKSDENSEDDKLDLINSIRRTPEERERLRKLSPKIIERYPNDFQLLMDFCKVHPCQEMG